MWAYKGHEHANKTLASRAPGREEEKNNRYGDHSDGEVKFNVCCFLDYDEKLHFKPEE